MKYNYPKAKVLSKIIDEYATKTPDKIAINDGSKSYSYIELYQKSKKVSSQLRSYGLFKGDRVCVMAKKSVEIIPYAIGIWKVGAIYSPLDPEIPQDRLERIIENIRPTVIVGEEIQREIFNKMGIYNYLSWEDNLTDKEINEDEEIKDDDNAIIIHTSGTTGLPKGVLLQHKSVIGYFNSHRYILGVSNESKCLNTANFYYDVSIQDTFQPLYFGAYVYIYKSFFIPELVLPLLQKEKFTLITAVSTILALITGNLSNLERYKLPHLKVISTGAEVCSIILINKWLLENEGLKIVNGYGPSEVNSVTVSYIISNPEPDRKNYFPIGKPHKEVKALLINNEYNKLINDIGITGELVLGGRQLMRGYWNNQQATDNAFIYFEGEKYYKTGDLCYYDENKNLVYLGRNDHEVKHNGRRINLLEISELIQKEFGYTAVDCFQHKFNDTIDSQLNVFIYVPLGYNNIFEQTEIVSHFLKKKLPQHSLPSSYFFYNQPLQTGSGKVNRKLLIDLAKSALNAQKSKIYTYEKEIFKIKY